MRTDGSTVGASIVNAHEAKRTRTAAWYAGGTGIGERWAACEMIADRMVKPVAGVYSVDKWGPVIEDSSAQYCSINGVAKINTEKEPYGVANEAICGRLGLLIGLPVPPGVVVSRGPSYLAYVALQFGGEERPPPVIPSHFVEDEPRLAAGAVVFDTWVCNTDRHEENVAYVREHLPEVSLFDHGRALFGWEAGRGIDRLQQKRDVAAISGCVANELRSEDELPLWLARVEQVRDDLIDEICRALVTPGGITADEASAAVEFLIYRKQRLRSLIVSGRQSMPKVAQWRLFV